MTRMDTLIEVISDALAQGYAVKIKREFTQNRITCIYKDNTSGSTLLPNDHFTDRQVAAAIKFNIDRHRKNK